MKQSRYLIRSLQELILNNLKEKGVEPKFCDISVGPLFGTNSSVNRVARCESVSSLSNFFVIVLEYLSYTALYTIGH